MQSFLYLADSSRFEGGAKPDGTSFELLIPTACLEGQRIDGQEIELWIAESRLGRVFLLSLFLVEEISTTNTSGYHLVVGSCTNSVHYRRVGADLEDYEITHLLSFETSKGVDLLYEIKYSDATVLHEFVKSRWKVSLRPQNPDKLEKLLHAYEALGPKALLDPYLAIALVKANYVESELYRSARNPAWVSPTISLAMEFCQTAGNFFDSNAFLEFEIERSTGVVAVPARMISTDLREFRESDFQARKFMWPELAASSYNFFDALRKTERAEARHQEILRDCCSYLKSKNVIPMMNVNVDLAFDSDNGFHVYEIKSANAGNFRDQVLKGFVQVLEYTHLFQDSGYKVATSAVVAEAPRGDFSMEYYAKLLASHGVLLLIYNSKLEWPERCAIPIYSQ